MKLEFTMIEVVLANTILVILVSEFANVTGMTLEQVHLKQQMLNWLHNSITGLF